MNKYRRITLIPTIYKIFRKLIQQRIKRNIEDYQAEEQAGFRKNRSPLDVVNQLIEKVQEYGIHICIAFVDFTKAFDLIYYNQLWAALENANVNYK